MTSTLEKWWIVKVISWSYYAFKATLVKSLVSFPYFSFKNRCHQGRIGLDKYNYIREAAHGVLARGGSEGFFLRFCADDDILKTNFSWVKDG